MATKNWSKNWKQSANPGKQRKHRENAPYHQRGQFLKARLADDLRETVGTKTLAVHEGDKVEIMRGDYTGATGEVTRVDREDKVVYIDGIDREDVGGAETKVPIRPSNLRLTKLQLDDDLRVAKYDVSEDEKESIKVEEAEEEAEADEEAEEGEVEETAEEDTEAEEPQESEDAEADLDYEELVQENITDIKERINNENLNPEKVLKAEQANKNRITLIEWLENKVGDDE